MTGRVEGAAPPLSRLLGQIVFLGADWIRLRIVADAGCLVPAGEEFTAHFVVRGRVDLSVEDEPPLVLRAGATAILPRGTRHALGRGDARATRRLAWSEDNADIDVLSTVDIGVMTHEEEVAVVLSARLHLDWPADLPRRQSLPSVLLGTRTYDDDRGAAESAARALDITARQPGASVCLTLFAQLLLVRELRDVLLSHPELLRVRDDVAAAMVRAVEVVRMRPSHPWTVERLARHVAMSRSSFAAAFKDFYGRSPMDVVTAQRMEIAARMLRESTMRVKAVAVRVGYHSDTAFLRRFTTRFGKAPTQYRRDAAGEVRVAPDLLGILK